MKYLIIAACLLASSGLMAQQCEVVLNSDDKLQFDQKDISVSANCSEVTLTLIHTGKLPRNQMGHNVVITETANFQDVAQASAGAGLDNDYVVPGDKRILAATKVIGGGEETSITFDVSGWDKTGDYTFFCSFPGHFAIMNGLFSFKE